MGSRLPCSCGFVEGYFLDFFKIACSILMPFPSSFFFMCLVIVHVVHPYGSMNKTTAWKKSHLFNQIDQTSIWLITCQENSMPLLGVSWHHFQWIRYCYQNMWTDPLILETRLEMMSFYLKYLYSVLFVFMWRLMLPAICFRLCSKCSIWAGVFMRTIRIICGVCICHNFCGIMPASCLFNVKSFSYIRSLPLSLSIYTIESLLNNYLFIYIIERFINIVFK